MSEEKQRALRPVERDLAWNVFWETLPYDRIMIGDGFSLIGNCAYFESADMPGWGTGDYYIVHLGGVGYKDATSNNNIYGEDIERKVRTVFIHELTHVWQAYHGRWVFTNSMFHQGCAVVSNLSLDARSEAYKYEPGKEWNDYNVEQQASIVEDWFVGGSSTESELYRYMNDHIWNC